MVKGSSALTIQAQICSMNLLRRAQEIYAKDTGILPRTAGEQRRVAGKFLQ